jgi:hypothetical protein
MPPVSGPTSLNQPSSWFQLAKFRLNFAELRQLLSQWTVGMGLRGGDG